MKRWLLVLAFCGALAPVAAQAWWQDAWSYRKKITIDATLKGGNIADAAGRVPLLVRLHTGNFGFTDVQDLGKDLRFVAADDQTALNFQIESFDPLLGAAMIWVDVPVFPNAGSIDLWMYYGNAKAPVAGDPGATFDADYTLVYHFDGAASEPPRDATAYANHAQSPLAALSEGGIIAGAARFNGGAPLTLPASPSLNPAGGTGFTFSTWVKPDAMQPQALLYAQRAGSTALLIGLDNGAPFVQVEKDGAVRRSSLKLALAAAQWTHLAVTCDKTTFRIYINGKLETVLGAELPFLATSAGIGADVTAATGMNPFTGELDELRLSRIERKAPLLLADATAQGAESKLVAYSEDEKQAGVGFGYFGIIVQSVTVDAWVVIGILMMMALISWIVMVSKNAYVGRVQGANELFVERFRKIGRDLLALENGGKLPDKEKRRFEDSSLYRLYSVGVTEVRSRMDDGGNHALSAESIEAIRASMDGTLVRENQRLARSMVLLTIAISGGPFLGLLGTVVGVMITFAAIAAAGDVNVNAIAPGISAALLATVAGLSVAIPALFGYNYLLGRNKNVSADMQVFVDEFVTRMAELFRPGAPAHHAHSMV